MSDALEMRLSVLMLGMSLSQMDMVTQMEFMQCLCVCECVCDKFYMFMMLSEKPLQGR